MISISPINRTKSPNPLIKINWADNSTKLTNSKVEIKSTQNRSPKRLFDAFCDYTSIAGFRFLHSRHPIWF
uniref:Uncharacterized protein n=1 Tax=Meloidogyne floridensis TaxID=298350 RepID=A0A915NIF2_9BILA